MASLALDKERAVGRLTDDAQEISLVLDEILHLTEEPTALRQGRKGKLLSREDLLKGIADAKALREALVGVPEDGRQLVVMINHVVSRFVTDPAWHGHPVVSELAAEVLNLNSLLVRDPEMNDPQWGMREQVGHIKDLLWTLQREIEHSAIDDPRMAIGFVLGEMEGVNQKELAALLGFSSDRSLRDLRSGKATTVRKNTGRIVLIAQIIYDLRNAMSPNGILAWFRRNRNQLNGKAPIDLINEDTNAADEPLRALARGVRGQLAT